MLKKYATADPSRGKSFRGPFVNPDTIDKVYRIMQSLKKGQEAIKSTLKMSFPTPSVGAIPTMTP